MKKVEKAPKSQVLSLSVCFPRQSKKVGRKGIRVQDTYCGTANISVPYVEMSRSLKGAKPVPHELRDRVPGMIL